MRYYIKCKLNPDGRKKLVDSIKSGNLAKGKIFYEGMQAALREAVIMKKMLSILLKFVTVWKVAYIQWQWNCLH